MVLRVFDRFAFWTVGMGQPSSVNRHRSTVIGFGETLMTDG